MLENIHISEELCFGNKKNNTIKYLNEALKKHYSKFDKAEKLSSEFVIVVDTSVLLQYYEISLKERKEFINALLKYKDQIYLTYSIQNEFLKNRNRIIGKFTKNLNKLLTEDFEKEVEKIRKLKDGEIDYFNNYLKNSVLKKGYPDIQNRIIDLNDNIKNKIKEILNEETFNNQISKLKDEINKESELALTEISELKWNDKILDIFQEFQLIEPLTKKEIEFISQKYKELLIIYSKHKGDTNLSPNYTFPGCGEIEERKENPESDFIIAHEIMKFMKDNNKDVIFLTKDVTKNDWINKSEKKMFSHYVSEFYKNTGQNLFIFDAEEALKVKLEEVFSEESINFGYEDIVDNLFQWLSSSKYEYKLLYGNHGLMLNFDWANQVQFIVREYDQIQYLGLNIWPANIKSQGYSIYNKSLNWKNRTLLKVKEFDFSIETIYELKFSDTWGRFICNLEYDDNALKKNTHTADNFYNFSGRKERANWGTVQTFLNEHFKEEYNWQEVLGWESNLLDTDRSVFVISFGFQTEILIPLGVLQVQYRQNNANELITNLIDNTIESFKQLVERQ